jgi:hypothetical protein
MLRGRRSLLIALALAAACSEPPDKERHQAEGALSAARAADAATYAPTELQAAEAALQKYDDAVAQRDYRQALNYALTAQDHAYQAAKTASNEKAAARSRAEKLIADLERLSGIASARVAGTTGPRPTAASAERLRALLKAAPHALQEAGTLVQRQDFRGAALRLTTVVEGFQRELGDADTGRRGRE